MAQADTARGREQARHLVTAHRGGGHGSRRSGARAPGAKQWRGARPLALFGVAVAVAAGVAIAKSGLPRLAPAGAPSPPGRASACQLGPAALRMASAYDRMILSLGPVLYLPLSHPMCGVEPDLSGNSRNGVYLPRNDQPGMARLPDGDLAADFDGRREYVQIHSAAALSISHTRALTVVAWIRPDVLQFPHDQGTGYVYMLGKGTPGRQEYALRMYSKRNSEDPVRPNRISAYVFNLPGGEGSGSYFQDAVTAGQWIMVTFVVADQPTPHWPHGYVAIYKDGILRGRVSLSQFHVTPRASTAPFRIGTRDLLSYFRGAIAKVAVFDRILAPREIAAAYLAMFAR